MNSADFVRCISIANKEFDRHQADTFRHWSFIFQRGRMIEWSQNRLGDPSGFHNLGYRDKRHSIHAEPRVLLKARGVLDRRRAWECVNVRLGANREPRMALPCWICFNYLKALNCRMVYYTNIEGIFANVDPRTVDTWEQYSQVTQGISSSARNVKRN